MTSSPCTARPLAAIAAGLLSLGLLAGCTPTPEPTPTKTAAFASDEEAFAAAEKTYEAYLSALNEVDIKDPKTFVPMFEWTTSSAEKEARKTFSNFHADGYVVRGRTLLHSFSPVSSENPTQGSMTAEVCEDVTEVEVLDESGRSVVSPGRPDIQPLLVTFVPGRTATTLAISSIAGDEGVKCDS